MDMGFSYWDYQRLIGLLQKGGYRIANYDNWKEVERPVILRHDIDQSISKACEFARLEKEMKVSATYFVLVTSDFYNCFSKKSQNQLKEIRDCGHELGLHFDETRYPEAMRNPGEVCEKILQEATLLALVTGTPVTKVSMHRPSKKILEANLQIPGMVNSYAKTFFSDFKYLSDSRHCWREPVLDIIETGHYERLHVLTHAFWYYKEEVDLKEAVIQFVQRGNIERYEILKDNFTNLEALLSKEEIV